ncbi:hypothetical protein SAMN04488061_2831 [Filomicrobium insigne]|uniref:Uncharacterized protein n=1 Tax=Filomicrobium insigne TaxID=418854 RepID=A0A1H0SBZ0_9HYPH|nr:hypothetical protein [Filomicrobium insigne]SDP39331.1 hypothetical protein SAMN04488061_2831 [Filomicrobium insigne]
MGERITVVWREWFDDEAVAELTAMGTLPRDETEISDYGYDGADTAAEVARTVHEQDSECFVNGGKIVILEPERYAGIFHVHVDFEPSFSATRDASQSTGEE